MYKIKIYENDVAFLVENLMKRSTKKGKRIAIPFESMRLSELLG